MLQSIEQQFIGDQTKQDALIKIEWNLIGGNIKREFAARGLVREHQHFGQLTRAVVDVPHDEALASGGPIDLAALSPASRRAWLHVAAVLVDGL